MAHRTKGFDEVALVTGGSSGIGRAVALAFGAVGVKVVVADIDEKGGQETVAEIQEHGGKASFVCMDVTEAESVEGLIREVTQMYGRIDYASNGVGIPGDLARIGEGTEENWDTVLKTNLKSIWLCMKYELIQMQKQCSGVIVNTASVYGLTGCGRGLAAYVASKHGIIGLSKAAALEYAADGIRVNVVCPGAIDTPFRYKLGESYCEDSKIAERYPIGRIGKPDEVANAVLWLCSCEATFITGSVITIDGGLTA